MSDSHDDGDRQDRENPLGWDHPVGDAARRRTRREVDGEDPSPAADNPSAAELMAWGPKPPPRPNDTQDELFDAISRVDAAARGVFEFESTDAAADAAAAGEAAEDEAPPAPSAEGAESWTLEEELYLAVARAEQAANDARAAAARAAENPEPEQPPSDEPPVDTAGAAVDWPRSPVDPPRPVDTRKLQLLRLLLIGNLVMIGLMLALPHPLETRPEYQSEQPDNGAVDATAPVTPPASVPRPAPRVATPSPVTPTAPAPKLGMPDDALYEQALLQAMEGDFDEASRSLEGFLAAHPDLNPALKQLVHAHLGYYLRKAGRVSEAIEHENAMRALAGQASLPQDLLDAARAAEKSGDGKAMRRAYAQFLLQRDQLSPSMRALIQEAYLEFGDSYRVGAEAGEERSK